MIKVYKIAKVFNSAQSNVLENGRAMKFITATELKNKTSEALATARHEPVTVAKNGRPIVVLLPQAEYERFMKMENNYWLGRLEAGEKSGYIGTEASAAALQQMLAKHADS